MGKDVNKQETLEEAAKIYAKIPLHREVDSEERYFNSNVREYDAFKAGANWQAERMYSEEDLQEAFYAHNQSWTDYERWFEQFKKK